MEVSLPFDELFFLNRADPFWTPPWAVGDLPYYNVNCERLLVVNVKNEWDAAEEFKRAEGEFRKAAL